MAYQSAVDHHPPINHDGRIENRHRATRADRQRQTAFGEDDHLSHLQVGCDRSEWEPGLFELRYRKIVTDEIFGPSAVVKSEARNRHTAKIVPGDLQGQLLNLIRCEARRVCSADQRTNAGAGDQVDGNLVLLQVAQYSDMCTTTSHPTAEREPDQRPIFLSIAPVFSHNFRSFRLDVRFRLLDAGRLSFQHQASGTHHLYYHFRASLWT